MPVTNKLQLAEKLENLTWLSNCLSMHRNTLMNKIKQNREFWIKIKILILKKIISGQIDSEEELKELVNKYSNFL